VVLLEDEVLEGGFLVFGLADPDVRRLVVDLPEPILFMNKGINQLLEYDYS
jgi:hypothetical protein